MKTKTQIGEFSKEQFNAMYFDAYSKEIDNTKGIAWIKAGFMDLDHYKKQSDDSWSKISSFEFQQLQKTEMKKIEIPEFLDVNAAREIEQITAQENQPVKTMTEQQEDHDISRYSWVAWLNVDLTLFFMSALAQEKDFMDRNWHCIPRDIKEEHQHEHENKKVLLELFCIDDKIVRKRLEKIIRRFQLNKPVEWMVNDIPKNKISKKATKEI
jgi:hypothetical protein